MINRCTLRRDHSFGGKNLLAERSTYSISEHRWKFDWFWSCWILHGNFLSFLILYTTRRTNDHNPSFRCNGSTCYERVWWQWQRSGVLLGCSPWFCPRSIRSWTRKTNTHERWPRSSLESSSILSSPSTLRVAIQGNKSSYPTRTHRIVFVFVVRHFTVAKRMRH